MGKWYQRFRARKDTAAQKDTTTKKETSTLLNSNQVKNCVMLDNLERQYNKNTQEAVKGGNNINLQNSQKKKIWKR